MNSRVRQNMENLIASIISCILAFFFSTGGEVHPWVNKYTNSDFSVFKTVALMMERGYMPYKDSFDHKGPLIYLINYWGNVIRPYRGVWIFELMALTVTFYCIYKVTRLVCNRKFAIAASLMAISLLFMYYVGGGGTEEYALPFISLALYIFLDYFVGHTISPFRLVLCGLSLGAVLLLRPNMITVWVVFCVAVLIKLLWVEKDYKALLAYILWFTVGVLLILLPIIVWLFSHGALTQCWRDYIVFNFAYTSHATLMKKCISFLYFGGSAVYFVSVLVMVLYCRKDNTFLNVTYLVYMFVSLLLICLGGRTEGSLHYGMVLVPVITYPMALFFAEVSRIQPQSIKHLICALLICSMILPDWGGIAKTLPEIYQSRNDGLPDGTVTQVCKIVEQYTEEDDAISVYGNFDLIYVISNRKHATRYSYQYPISWVNPDILKEYLEQLQKEQPKVIVLDACDDNIMNFLEKNSYELVFGEKKEDSQGLLVYAK